MSFHSEGSPEAAVSGLQDHVAQLEAEVAELRKDRDIVNFSFEAFHEFRCADDPVIVAVINGPCSETNFTLSLEEARDLVEEIQAAIENAESSMEAPE